MERKTQMTGIRLGFTYAAAIVLLALLIANLNTPAEVDANGAGVAQNLPG
jgi:hypothetical protein